MNFSHVVFGARGANLPPIGPQEPKKSPAKRKRGSRGFDVTPDFPGSRGYQPLPPGGPTGGPERSALLGHNVRRVNPLGNTDARWWNWDGSAGHYWHGFPCTGPNCGYGDHGYRRPSGQGHGPDFPGAKYGDVDLTPQGPGSVYGSGRPDLRENEYLRPIVKDINDNLFGGLDTTPGFVGRATAALARRKRR